MQTATDFTEVILYKTAWKDTNRHSNVKRTDFEDTGLLFQLPYVMALKTQLIAVMSVPVHFTTFYKYKNLLLSFS